MGEAQELENIENVDDFPDNNLLVVCSTDKGLCGGVNTILSRNVRTIIAKLEKAGKSYKIFVCGDKGRSQLRRQFGDHFVGTATERVMPYSFELASSIATDLESGEYDAVHLMYNKFKSAIAYTPSIQTIKPLLDPTDMPALPSMRTSPLKFHPQSRSILRIPSVAIVALTSA